MRNVNSSGKTDRLSRSLIKGSLGNPAQDPSSCGSILQEALRLVIRSMIKQKLLTWSLSLQRAGGVGAGIYKNNLNSFDLSDYFTSFHSVALWDGRLHVIGTEISENLDENDLQSFFKFRYLNNFQFKKLPPFHPIPFSSKLPKHLILFIHSQTNRFYIKASDRSLRVVSFRFKFTSQCCANFFELLSLFFVYEKVLVNILGEPVGFQWNFSVILTIEFKNRG